MSSLPNLLLRDATVEDHAVTATVLAAAFAGGAVARWLEPDDDLRREHAAAYFRAAVEQAATHGIVRVAQERDVVVGAALWFPYPRAVPAAAVPPDPVPDRLRRLGRLLDERHPIAPVHHHLAFLGVRPDRQSHGIGTCLLIGHHAFLHVAGMPAYLEATDPRNRALYLRHGYADLGDPITPADGIRIWPMWRNPEPAGVEPRPWSAIRGTANGKAAAR